MRNASRGLAIVLLAVAGLIPAPARAQDAADHPLARGTRSLSFGLPSGGGTSFGYWVMTSDRTNLGLRATLGLRHAQSGPEVGPDQESTGWGVELSPAIKRYGEELGPVLPFLYGGISAGVGRSSEPGDRTSTQWNAGASAGIGAEWFPVRSVSIGGYTGASLGHTSSGTENATGESTTREWRLSTLTSGLSLHIYFGGPRAEAPAVAGRN